LNVAVYHTDWSDLQQVVLLSNFSKTCSGTLTVNVGAAVIDGAEVEFVAVPTDKLSLRASLGYTDARVVDPGPFPTVYKDDPILRVPDWTGSLLARYETPINTL